MTKNQLYDCLTLFCQKSLAVAFTFVAIPVLAEPQITEERVLEEQAYTVGVQAYIWGYPLVNSYNRRKKLTAFPDIGVVNETLPVAPINSLSCLPASISAKQRLEPFPNNDTLHCQGWTDLSQEAVVLHLPDFQDRYWVVSMMDAYTNVFASPGKRRQSKAGYYLIVGPDWKGNIPIGIVEVLRSPTNLVRIASQVLIEGERDRAKVVPLLDGIVLFPLSQYGTAATTIEYGKTAKYQAANPENDWTPKETFWEDLKAALADISPSQPKPSPLTLVEKTLAQSEDPAAMKGLTRAIETGEQMVETAGFLGNLGTKYQYGWTAVSQGANFGDDYLTRAGVAYSLLSLQLPQDAVYYQQLVDEEGQPLNGSNAYVLHFEKSQLPPVREFWSLSLYGENNFFIDNPIDRYSIGNLTTNLKYNDDGSLDIYLQSDPPADENLQANWLPTPARQPFKLILRTYMPGAAIVGGTYNPPPVKKLKTTEDSKSP